MRQVTAAGILLLFIGIREGVSTAVNLSEVVEKYIQEIAQNESLGDVDSWSQTANYGYWTGKHFTDGEYPIKAKVKHLHCEKNESRVVHAEETDCQEVFIWNIAQGIQSPFHLYVNVTVPMLRKEGAQNTAILQLDINNETVINEDLKNRTKRSKAKKQRKVTRSCLFRAEVTFDGYFAFHIKRTRGDYPNYHGVNVVKLANRAGGLVANETVLAYNVTGNYTQTLCRHNGVERKKRHVQLN